MKSVEFCYWLQGLFELENPKTLNAKKTQSIRKHLQLVFKHEIDPSYPESQQEELNDIHGGSNSSPASAFVPAFMRPEAQIRC